MILTEIQLAAIKFGIVALVLGGIVVGIHHHGTVGGRAEVQTLWDADKAARLTATNSAILTRVAANADLAKKQTADNAAVTKAKNEELSPVVASVNSRRVFVGTNGCRGGGPTAPASTESPASGDGADPAGRMVRPETERDIKAFVIEVETHLATGRACQAVLDKNGMIP